MFLDTPEAVSRREQEEWDREYEKINGDFFRKNSPRKISSTSSPGMVLWVARGIGKPFTLSELTVQCWLSFPMAFCLPGLPEYPSDRRVNVTLCGRKGLLRMGLIKKMQGGLYIACKE